MISQLNRLHDVEWKDKYLAEVTYACTIGSGVSSICAGPTLTKTYNYKITLLPY
jgi:hypothetical protein